MLSLQSAFKKTPEPIRAEIQRTANRLGKDKIEIFRSWLAYCLLVEIHGFEGSWTQFLWWYAENK